MRRPSPRPRWRWLPCLLCVAALAGADDPASTADEPVSVDYPTRAFGYVLGDLLIQRIGLPRESGNPELATIGVDVRVGPWLERQAASITPAADGRRWLTLRYQIVNAPMQVITAALPPLQIEVAAAEPLRIDAWPFSLGPLTPAPAATGQQATIDSADAVSAPMLPAVLGDRFLPALDTRAARERVTRAGIVLLSIVLAWLLWWVWRQRRDRVQLPFAHAWQTLRKRASPADDSSADNFGTLHRAFNRTAGRTVNPKDIERLLSEHRWLAPHQTQIERFFEASTARFFAESPIDETLSPRQLCRTLARAEKRHAA